MIFSFNQFFGQTLGDYYVPISTDSTSGGRLKFLSDSTVELSSMPHHVYPSDKMVYKYTGTDSTIEILPEPVSKADNQQPRLSWQHSILNASIRLTKIQGGFIDYTKSLIYVRAKDFDKNPDLTYVVNDKIYIQDMGVTNGYGLLRKSPKTNKALRKKMRTINLNNCTLEIVRGLNAYQRFGIKKVYGVIVITSNQ
jgi:hypothetical protein